MSKFFLTNSVNIYQKVDKIVSDSEYEISFVYSKDELYAVSTKKISVDNKNGVELAKGFAIVTGTMAWKNGEPVKADTLTDIYTCFTKDVNQIRRLAIGNYAASICKDGELYVFGELIGFYNIYYYDVNGEWLISNDLYDMSAALDSKLSLNNLAITEATVQDGILLGDTYFNEIHRLSGYNYLKISSGKMVVIEEQILYPMATGALKEKAERYASLARDYGVKMSAAYGTPCISMTGGLDARIVLSTYLSVGIKPHLYYGTGNSFITNTFNEDKEIDKLFSKKFDLTFHEESWETPSPVDKYWDEYLKMYGFYYDTYGGSDAIMESIKSNQCNLFTYGYCGELLRNLPWIETRKTNYFTLDEYINEFYVTPAVIKEVKSPENYISYIREKQLRICKLYNLDPSHIANEDIFYLSLERRKSADSAMLNLVNFMKFCCYTIGEYSHLLAGRVTVDEAFNSSFMLYCLDALKPEVLDVPVFSHCTIRDFYRETMSLSPQVKPLSNFQKIKGVIKRNFPIISFLLNKIIRKDNIWRFAGDEQIYNRVQSLCREYDDLGVVCTDCFEDQRRLLNYVTKLYAFKSLNY